MCDPLIGQAQASFVGPSAATADLTALANAKALAAEGRAMNDIRVGTGWFQGQDGAWRFEIDDSGATARMPLHGVEPGSSMPLGEFMDHPELFAAYPQMRTIPMEVLPAAGVDGRRRLGVYTSSPPQIGVAASTFPVPIILHEGQHHIQDVEGFDTGTSPKQAAGDAGWDGSANTDTLISIGDIFKAYQADLGEAEARDVGDRYRMTPEQRLAKPPRLMKP